MGESTKGVVVEVKEVKKELTINLLMEVLQEEKFKNLYKHAIFVPFGYLTKAFRINEDEFVDRQNAFMKNT